MSVIDQVEKNVQEIKKALELRGSDETAGAKVDRRFGRVLDSVSQGAVRTVQGCPEAFTDPNKHVTAIQAKRDHLDNLKGVHETIVTLGKEIKGDIVKTTAELASETGYVYETTTSILSNPDSPLKTKLAHAAESMTGPMKQKSTARGKKMKKTHHEKKAAAQAMAAKDQAIAKLEVENKYLQGDKLTPADVVEEPLAAKTSARRPRKG